MKETKPVSARTRAAKFEAMQRSTEAMAEMLLPVRYRILGKNRWREYLLRLSRSAGEYDGFRIFHGESIAKVLSLATQRRLLREDDNLVKGGRHADTCTTIVYTTNKGMRASQTERRFPLQFAWATVNEILDRSVCGKSVHEKIAEAVLYFEGIQAKAQRPLAVYHGTGAGYIKVISDESIRDVHALKVGNTAGMLGHGIYFGDLESARRFAFQFGSGEPRPAPGGIIRCLLFPAHVHVLTSDHRCSCGWCLGRPFVDHRGELSGKHRADLVCIPRAKDGGALPSSALRGATTHGEFKITDPSICAIDFFVHADTK